MHFLSQAKENKGSAPSRRRRRRSSALHLDGFDSAIDTKTREMRLHLPCFGAADRNRTGTDFTPRDFKSLVSTYSTTAAYIFYYRYLLLNRVASLLRYPVCALATVRLRCTPTAATRSASCICHRQRSPRFPPQRRIYIIVYGVVALAAKCNILSVCYSGYSLFVMQFDKCHIGHGAMVS